MKTSPLLIAGLITFGFCSVSQAVTLAAWRFTGGTLDATTTSYGSGTVELGAAWTVSGERLAVDSNSVPTFLASPGAGAITVDYTVSGLAADETLNINSSQFLLSDFGSTVRYQIEVGGESVNADPVAEGFYTEYFTGTTGLVNGDVVTLSFALRDGASAVDESYIFDGWNITGTIVPEPSSTALLGLGGLALLARRKR